MMDLSTLAMALWTMVTQEDDIARWKTLLQAADQLCPTTLDTCIQNDVTHPMWKDPRRYAEIPERIRFKFLEKTLKRWIHHASNTPFENLERLLECAPSLWEPYQEEIQRRWGDILHRELQAGAEETVTVTTSDGPLLVPRHVACQFGALPSLQFSVTAHSAPYDAVFGGLVDLLQYRTEDLLESLQPPGAEDVRKSLLAAADYFLLPPQLPLSLVGPPGAETSVATALRRAPAWARVLEHSAMWTARMLLPDWRDRCQYGGLVRGDLTLPDQPWTSSTLVRACEQLQALEMDGFASTVGHATTQPSELLRGLLFPLRETFERQDSYRDFLEPLERFWYRGDGRPGLFLAGGSVECMLLGCPIKDLDLFVIVPTACACAPSDRENVARDILFAAHCALRGSSQVATMSYVQSHCSGFVFGGGEVQFVHRAYHSPAEVLHGFDLPSCAVGWDGQTTWLAPRAFVALNTRRNWVDPSRQSTSFEHRLVKKAQIGIKPLIPLAPDMLREVTNSCHYEDRGLVKLVLHARKVHLNLHVESDYMQTLSGDDRTVPFLTTAVAQGDSFKWVGRFLRDTHLLPDGLDRTLESRLAEIKIRVVEPGTQHTSSFHPTHNDWYGMTLTSPGGDTDEFGYTYTPTILAAASKLRRNQLTVADLHDLGSLAAIRMAYRYAFHGPSQWILALHGRLGDYRLPRGLAEKYASVHGRGSEIHYAFFVEHAQPFLVANYLRA